MSPYAFAFMCQWDACIRACKWVPIWPQETTGGPVLGWWRQAFWQECRRLLGELRGRNALHSTSTQMWGSSALAKT